MSTNNVKNHSPLKYRPDIDGMRAIAIILVVIYHAFPKFITGGFFGVDVFFVLSGYLISTIIIEQLNSNSFRLTDFYVRRIKRIVPALITVMVVSLILGWFLLLPMEYKQLGKHLLGGSTFISNFLSWNEVGYFDGAAESKPLLHLWSLSVEEQFYLLWPITLSWFYTKKYNLFNLIGLIALFSFILNIILVKINTEAAFYFPVARFWELMLGAMIIYCTPKTTPTIAFIRNHRSFISFLGLFVIVAVCLYVKKQFQIPGFWALLPTLGAALLIISENGWVNRNVLSSRFMVWLGQISYPLYLWHWPILSFLHITHDDIIPRPI